MENLEINYAINSVTKLGRKSNRNEHVKSELQPLMINRQHSQCFAKFFQCFCNVSLPRWLIPPCQARDSVPRDRLKTAAHKLNIIFEYLWPLFLWWSIYQSLDANYCLSGCKRFTPIIKSALILGEIYFTENKLVVE